MWHHSRSFTSNKYGCVSALSVYMEHVPGSPPLLVRAVCGVLCVILFKMLCVPPLVRISYLVNVPASCGVAAEAGAC